MENVRILKSWKGGIEDKKAKPVDVPCFVMDSIGTQDTCKKAMALNERGYSVLPDLEMAEVVGFYGSGLRVRGVCTEVVGKYSRKVYCEWFVFYPEKDS